MGTAYPRPIELTPDYTLCDGHWHLDAVLGHDLHDPAEAENRQGMHPEVYAPASERPVESPRPAAAQNVDYAQSDVDRDVDARVDVEALEGLDARMRSVVALLLLIHMSFSPPLVLLTLAAAPK